MRHAAKRMLMNVCLVLAGLCGSPFAIAEDEQLIDLVAPTDDQPHGEQSLDFIRLVLTTIRDDVTGEAANPALSSPLAECNGTLVEKQPLLDWLDEQILRIDSGLNIQHAEEAADLEPEDFLSSIWEQRGLDEVPALVLVDYQDRTTWFYTQSQYAEQFSYSAWAARSPACGVEDCDEDIEKEQRPMYQAARVLALSYLLDYFADDSSPYLVRWLINTYLSEIDQNALDPPARARIERAVKNYACISVPMALNAPTPP